MKRIWLIAAFSLAILAGTSCTLYPLVSNTLYEARQDTIITEYTAQLENVSSSDQETARQEATAYNNRLLNSTAILTDPFDPSVYQTDDAVYDALLNMTGDGIMGYLEIPVISVLLPIYHGTSEEVLEKGVGHLLNSSLPVGGTGSHAVLTGHTGLSGKRLFTDLTSLTEGDVFYVHTLGETLCYQVDQISVVLPNETNALRIDPNEDYVTLLTCTPYGVNDHRLLVRGVRVEDEEAAALSTSEASSSEDAPHISQWQQEYRKALLIGLGCTALLLAAMISVLKRYTKEQSYTGRRLLP